MASVFLVVVFVFAPLGRAVEPIAAGPKLSPSETIIRATDMGLQLFARPAHRPVGSYRIAAGPSPRSLRAKILTNINAADATNADQTWLGGGLGLNLTGTGITVEIWDGGAVRWMHQELAGRVTVLDDVFQSSHATHVAGTIGASGVNPLAHGMAAGVLLRSRDFNNDLAEMAADASLASLSNHSYAFIRGWTRAIDWGIGAVDTWFADRAVDSTEDSEFSKYEDVSQALDQVLHDNPFLLSVWAAANDRGEAFVNAHGTNEYVSYFSADPGGIGWTGPGFYVVLNAGVTSAPPPDGNGGTGYDCLPNDQVAKNSLVVGAIYDVTIDPYAVGDVGLAGFSSTGPVDDGRIKPDVVGNGVGLTSCISTGDVDYASFSGTSMASPNVCGSAALLVQHYRNLTDGSFPASAMTKALLIHTAFDAGSVGPDYLYGWGLVDAAAAAKFLNDARSLAPNVHHLVQASYTGTAQDYPFVAAGAGPFKATLVWNDPPPSVLPGFDLDDPARAIVNDLDLIVIGPPGSTTYRPWTLDRANPAAAAIRTSRNAVDNVEQVLIDAPSAGTYTVRVSHTVSASAQDYSLLVSVDRGCAICPGDIDGDGRADGRDLELFVTCKLGGGTPGQRACADMNADGAISPADDSLLVLRLLASPHTACL